MRVGLVLGLVAVVAQFSQLAHAVVDSEEAGKTKEENAAKIKEEEDKWVLYGKGNAPCEDELPTLSVAKENLINTP